MFFLDLLRFDGNFWLDFTSSSVNSSQKFPSNLKRSKKKTFSVKLEKDENIAFKLKRFKKNRQIEEFYNFLEEPKDFCTSHQNRSRKLRAGNFCQIKKTKSKIFQDRSLRKEKKWKKKFRQFIKGQKSMSKVARNFLPRGLKYWEDQIIIKTTCQKTAK